MIISSWAVIAFYFVFNFDATEVNCNNVTDIIFKYEPYSVLKRKDLISLFTFDRIDDCISVAPFSINANNRLISVYGL